MPRISFRLRSEDETAIAVIREHLRLKSPWVSRTDTIRAALREAVEALESRKETQGR